MEKTGKVLKSREKPAQGLARALLRGRLAGETQTAAPVGKTDAPPKALIIK